MKKVISFILTAMLIFTSTGCNKKTTVNPPPPNVNKPVQDINKQMNKVPTTTPVVPPVITPTTPTTPTMPVVPPVIPPTPIPKTPPIIGAAPPITNINQYKNGTCIGKSDKTKTGYAYSKITISKGKITGVTLKRFDSKGNQIKYTTSMIKDRDNMINMIKNNQGLNFTLKSTNIEEVNAWRTATARALNKAKMGQYKDGTCTGMSDKTTAGYGKATLTIKDGKITKVSLRKYNAKGKQVKYTKTMIKDRDVLIKMLKQKQNINFTTTATNKEIVNEWKTAITRAIDKAKK